MVRPLKKGLQYFPVDTGQFGDRKILRLLNRYGCEGYTVYALLLCEIYGNNGYYMPFSSELCFDIGFTLSCSEQKVGEIIRFCVEIRLFDETLFLRQMILTSGGIQRRFREICRRRNQYRIDPQLAVGDVPEAPGECPAVSAPEEVLVTKAGVIATKTGVMAAKTGVMATETPVMAAKTPPNIKGNKNGNKKKNTTTDTFVSAAPPSEDLVCVAAHFNRIFAGKLPAVLILSPAREQMLAACIALYGREGVLRIFDKACACPFLMGDNTRGWHADFDWLLQPEHLLRISEDFYSKQYAHERQKTTSNNDAARRQQLCRMAAEAAADDSRP